MTIYTVPTGGICVVLPNVFVMYFITHVVTSAFLCKVLLGLVTDECVPSIPVLGHQRDYHRGENNKNTSICEWNCRREWLCDPAYVISDQEGKVNYNINFIACPIFTLNQYRSLELQLSDRYGCGYIGSYEKAILYTLFRMHSLKWSTL